MQLGEVNARLIFKYQVIAAKWLSITEVTFESELIFFLFIFFNFPVFAIFKVLVLAQMLNSFKEFLLVNWLLKNLEDGGSNQ